MAGLDFGPVGSADVTANVMESAPSGKVVHEAAEPDTNQPLLKINLPIAKLNSESVQKVRHPALLAFPNLTAIQCDS